MDDQHGGEAVVEEVEREVSLLVKSGIGTERMVRLERGATLAALLIIYAKERGCTVEELIVVREGEHEPISELVVIDVEYPHQKRHHVHHAGVVKVTVFYGGKEHHREFKRHDTIEEVLTWAIKVFAIDPAMAGEFELARHGQKEELPGSEHVGHVAGHHKDLALDLVRGDIANGCGA